MPKDPKAADNECTANNLNNQELNLNGLNLQHVFNLADLPSKMLQQLKFHNADLKQYSQLILIGHAGQTLWDALPEESWLTENPIDNFTENSLKDYFKQQQPNANYKIIYPSTQPVGLQALGTLAGWHHPSPFMVGINNIWGSWFAYRAAVLANTTLTASDKLASHTPCNACHSKICIEVCPANACSLDSLDMKACLAYRRQVGSKCKKTCLARVACPVAKEHKYKKAQIQYHYGVSLKMIEAYENKKY